MLTRFRANGVCALIRENSCNSWLKNFAAGKAKSALIRFIRVIRAAIIVALVFQHNALITKVATILPLLQLPV